MVFSSRVIGFWFDRVAWLKALKAKEGIRL